jgi:hypothetical protein
MGRVALIDHGYERARRTVRMTLLRFGARIVDIPERARFVAHHQPAICVNLPAAGLRVALIRAYEMPGVRGADDAALVCVTGRSHLGIPILTPSRRVAWAVSDELRFAIGGDVEMSIFPVEDRRASTDQPLAAEPNILTIGQVIERGLRGRRFDAELDRAVRAGEIEQDAAWVRGDLA